MGRIEKTVFISYRRTDFPWALAIYQNLTAHDYDVFFDYQSINSGDFEQIILENIKARAHFLVVLTPTALERCNTPSDWLRREIETALIQKRNIVPLFFEGFDFSKPFIAKSITGKLALLKNYNGLNIPADYFIEAMGRLQSRFLNIHLDAVIHPLSNKVQKDVYQQQLNLNEAIKSTVGTEKSAAQRLLEIMEKTKKENGHIYDKKPQVKTDNNIGEISETEKSPAQRLLEIIEKTKKENGSNDD